MNLYLGVKLVHILSATLLFGTGLGTAFFMFCAYRSDDAGFMRNTLRSVVRADWLFTTPAVLLQLLTGLWLAHRLGIPLNSVWFTLVIGLFVFVGMCWLPVVWIQIRLRDRLHAGATVDDCRVLMRIWIALGVPAFLGVLCLFGLMIYKPWLALSL